jgi:hypothetical protein
MSLCTRSTELEAWYLRINRARWISTVRWLMARALPICHFALARGELGAHRAARAEVFKAPDTGLVGRLALQGTAGDVAPERFALEAAIHPLHDPVVRIGAIATQDGFDARARAFVFGHAGVEQLKTLAKQLLARGAEHVAQRLVAVDHDPSARERHAQRRKLEGEPVVDIRRHWLERWVRVSH